MLKIILGKCKQYTNREQGRELKKNGKISGFWGDAKAKVGETKGRLQSSAEKTASDYKVSERIHQVRNTVGENTPDFVKTTAGKVNSSLDTVSGAKLLAEVREMVSLQEKYNDVLATKLEEALQRIQVLEAIVGKGNQQ